MHLVNYVLWRNTLCWNGSGPRHYWKHSTTETHLLSTLDRTGLRAAKGDMAESANVPGKQRRETLHCTREEWIVIVKEHTATAMWYDGRKRHWHAIMWWEKTGWKHYNRFFGFKGVSVDCALVYHGRKKKWIQKNCCTHWSNRILQKGQWRLY